MATIERTHITKGEIVNPAARSTRKKKKETPLPAVTRVKFGWPKTSAVCARYRPGRDVTNTSFRVTERK